MRLNHAEKVACIVFASTLATWAQPTRVSMCSLQRTPERFVNSEVEVRALIFAGEYPRIKSNRCTFLYTMGNDYQILESRFPIKDDDQWELLRKLLDTRECASNMRVAKARIVGTIVRVPATGTIPANEMPFELIIQSVSEVEHVPVNCRAAKH